MVHNVYGCLCLCSLAEVLEEEELLEARCQTVQGKLQEQQQSQDELHEELSHKGVLVGALRASLKEKERHFLDELKNRSHRSTAVNSELQKQSKVAAHLSFQLHAARQKLQQQQECRMQEMLWTKHPTTLSLCQTNGINSTMVKPKRRRGGQACSLIRSERARECVPCERVMGPEEPMAMPDPALFLHPRRPRSLQIQTHTIQGVQGAEGTDESRHRETVSRLVSTIQIKTAATAESKAE